MKKYIKKLIIILLLLVVNIMGILPVQATTEFIQLGSGTMTKSYVAGVGFSYEITTDGKYTYCTNAKKNSPQNVKAFYVKNSRYVNGGVLHILKNGYPNKSITGDKDKDYYITQTALWWYLDMTTGSTNLGEQFKNNGSDTYGLRQQIKSLAYDGYNHRKDSISHQEVKFAIESVGGNTMTLKDSNYISNTIKASTAQNINSYTISLNNAPSGTRIISSTGVESVYSKEFKLNANDSFKVKVPVASLTNTKTEIKVNAVAEGISEWNASEYQPSDMSMQSVVLLEENKQTIPSTITLSITSSKVTISKIDSNTKQAIAGAKLVLKNESGTTVANWTSTTNSHILHNLPNGNYTIEEIEAPSGYLVNKNITRFTISEQEKDIVISIENTPRKAIVNIVKIDQESKNPLAGAVLVVRNASGGEIARFTTTTNPYVIENLSNGVYTIEEIEAPAGYVRNNNKISFTIDENHLSHQITMANTKEIYIPDTLSNSSILITMIGIVTIGTAIIFIKKNEPNNE